ncbi:peptidoglycan DD-metalloendopeptidase family protein [Actinomyces sp. 186855]|uniref:peptidoglycan DD-metalloendopeptidase family protein n=2 Tax=unclassified Actinomyces TaxID=2609248 RepID=UPI002A2E26ED|nr:peptidoglycan DD-metalloendopeptidase family protein [Actinomyces sp. AC-20-1]MCL3789879.1 peptidoglycan DD-metalloendopeptidase family protein [Actinomyces sp. 187325]MCL3792216.1 peptidoglycan DD-metalloendopeptidase family protein [Actinomyces sp. 186855]MCL3794778.1 peptidoglycan DD-metalloendopeptidase family protein [Actinomyces sp. 217892]
MVPLPHRPAAAGHQRLRASSRRGRARRGLALLAALCLLAAPMSSLLPGASADERSDAVADRDQAEQRAHELTASLEGVSAELGQAYLDLLAAQSELATAETALADAETVLAEKEREQQAAADRLDVAESQLETLEAEATASERTASENEASVASLVVSAYQGDSSITSWSYVLASDSVEDLTQRASAMEIASGVQSSVLAAAEEERAQAANRRTRQDAVAERVSLLKEEADAAESEAQEAADAAQTRRDEVATLTTERETAAATLETHKAGLEAQLVQAQADQDAAAATIAQIDAANQASAGYTGSSSGSVAAAALGSGAIGHPITGALTVASPYGYRIHPITGARTLHEGVDLVAAQGVPQYAAVSGTVTYNINSSCGNGVVINGGVINGQSVVLYYCHLSSITAGNGSYVTKGDQVGLTGMTGGATGPHVHFEVYLNGASIDPMTLPGF